MATHMVVKLFGCLSDGSPAKTHQTNVVSFFVGNTEKTAGYFQISKPDHKNQITLKTPKGVYTLIEGIGGVYQPDPFTHRSLPRLEITLKKISGKLIYWA